MSDNTAIETEEQEIPTIKPKSYWIAYFSFFTLGWVGGHRFYVGKWTSGFLYLIFLYLFNFAIIFPMMVDFILLFFIVKKTYTQPVDDPLRIFLKIIFSRQGHEKSLAPWAEVRRNPTTWLVDFIDNTIRVVLFLGGPIWVLMFSFYMSNSLEISILMVFILIFAGYIGPMNRVLNTIQRAFQKSPSLARMPFLTDVVDTMKEFYDYYYNHKPHNVIYYLFYPITILFSLFSHEAESARNEFKLYKNIIMLTLITLIIESMFSYSSTYPPYLTMMDAIGNIAVIVILSLFTLIIAVIPTITTCFKFRFSNKRGSLALFTTISLIMMGMMFYEFEQKEMVPLTANHLIKEKLSKEAFRQELAVKTEMFLTYYVPKIQDKSSTQVIVNQKLTDLYRQQLLALASTDEVKTLHVLTIPDPNSTNTWLGIHYASIQFDQMNRPVLLLFLISPTGEIYRSWANVPGAIKRYFTLLQGENINEKTYTYDKISQYGLVDEYH